MLRLGIGLLVGASVAVDGNHRVRRARRAASVAAAARREAVALLIPSAVGGAALVLAGDIVVRLLPGGSELQLGVVMSLVGAPFFFVFLYSMRRRVT